MIEKAKATQIGVDTGGTFTDIIKKSAEGRLSVHKLLSTPSDPSEAIGAGVAALLEPKEAIEVVHGTTVATNALLERRGAKVAFVTTAGFEDLLWMGRQARPYLYALQVEVEAPLVEPGFSFGVRERISSKGEVLERLEPREIDRVIEAVAEAEVEAVVICLLHSYANGSHEEILSRAFRSRGAGRWHVTASREVTSTFREYERGSTAAVNGYVGPVMARYLQKLKERLAGARRLEVMQSHGGRTDAEHAARLPVHTVLSGPAGGVVGALEAAREVGIDKIISFDMGGTSTDVSLADGAVTITEEGKIGSLPLQVPVIDIYTVGAGGGSLARIDAGGALRVGPESAGAAPGPVAYGRGGTEPTVTDAHVALGSLPARRFLGGEMVLEREAAHKAIEVLAARLGMDWRATAAGILSVADAAMARAIKVISLERGYDPRDYALVAFGGAGGLHGCRLAENLQLKRVLIPRFPGLLSAVGMLRADARRLYSRSVLWPLQEVLKGGGTEELRRVLAELESQAREEMKGEEDEDESELFLKWTGSFRYQGQSFSLALELDWGSGKAVLEDPKDRFEAEHEKLYGYRAQGRGIELVDLRLEIRRCVGGWAKEPAPAECVREDIPDRFEEIDLGGGPERVRVVERREIAEGARFSGPAVITEYSGTTVVLKGWEVQQISSHLLLTREEDGQSREER